MNFFSSSIHVSLPCELNPLLNVTSKVRLNYGGDLANGRNPPLVRAIPYPLSFLFPLDATAPNTGMFKRIIIEPRNLQVNRIPVMDAQI